MLNFNTIVFEGKCWDWLAEVFGSNPEVLARAQSVDERSRRFLEEAIELVQATGLTKGDVLKLMDYVYDRPVGEPHQEVGGTLVTLAVLCKALSVDMVRAGNIEIDRCYQPEVMEKIRKKQVTKQLAGIGGTPLE